MNWDSYGNEDILDVFDRMREAGEDITVVKYPFENTEKRHDEAFENAFRAKLEEEKADIVFSFNYYPLISKTVQSVYDSLHTRYVSWVYDCPHISLYSYTLINPCNAVFLFDSTMYKTFALQNINTVYYLPMAASVRRLDALHCIRRFTPRKKGSKYSQPNIERLIWLDARGMIHPSVRESVLPVIRAPFEFPPDILAALRQDVAVWENYQRFSEPYKRIRIAYIDAARKRPEEFRKRLNSFIEKTRRNKLILGYGGIEKYYR